MDETKQDDGSNAKDDDDDILEAFGISTAPSKDSPREYYTASENEDDDDFAEEGDDDADILEAFGVTDPPKESPRGYHSASENKYENDDSDTLEAFGDNGPQEEENSKNQNTVPTDDEDDGDILEAFGVEDSPNQESASSSEDEEDNADILEAFGVEGSPNQESASSSEDEEDNADVLEAFGVTGSPNQESVSPSEDDEDDADILEAFGVTGSPNRESPSEDDEDDADILEAFGVTGSPNRSDDDEDDADILETFGVTGSPNQESASPSEDDEDDADILEAFGVTGSSEDEISKEPSIEDDADNADILEAFDFSSPPREVSGVPNTMLDGKDDDEGDGADVLEAFSPSSEEVAEQYIRVASLPVEQLQQNEKQKTMSHSQHAVGSQERRGSFFQLFGSPRPQQRISEAMLEEEKRVKFQIVKDFVGEDKATPPTKWGSLIIDEASKEAERGFKLPEIPLSNDESHLEDSSSSAGSPPSSPRKEKAISGNSPDDTPLQGAEEQESDVDTSHHSSVFGSLRNMFQGDLEIAGADSVDESEHPRTNQKHKLGEESSNPRPTSDVVDKITEDVGSIDEDTKSFKEDQKQDDVIDSSRRSSAFGSLRNLFQGDPATNHTSTEPTEHDAEDQVDGTAPQDPVRDNNLEEDEKLDKTNSRVDQEQNDDNAIDMSKRSSVFGSLRDLFQGELERNPKDAKVANGSNQNNIDLIEEIDDSQPDGPIVNPDQLEAQFMTPEPQKSLLGVLGLSSSTRESLLLPKAEEEDVLEETSIEREEITDEIASPQAQKSLLGFPGLSLPQSESKALPELEDEATPEKKDVLNEESKKEKKFVEPEAPTQTLFGFRFLGPKPANAKATEEIQGTKSEESNNSAAIPNNEQQQKSAPSPAKEVAPKQKAPPLFGFFRQGQKQEEAESIRTNPLELEKQKQEERLKLLLGEEALEEQQLAQKNLIQAAKVQESEQPISDQAADKTNGGNSKTAIKSAGFESFFSPKPKAKGKKMSSKTDASDNKKDVEHTEASQEVAPYVPIVIEEDAYTPKEPRVSVFGSLFSPGRDESSPPEKSLNASSKEEMMTLEKSDETKGDEVIEADSVEDAKDTLQVSSRSFVESNENKQGGPRVGVFGSIFNSNRSEGMLSEKDHDEEKSESDTEKYSVEVAAESAKSTGPVVEHMGTKSALELEKERQQKLLMDLLKLDENAMKDQQDQQAVLVSQTVSQKKEGRSTLGSESLEAPKELVATVDENDVTAPKNSRFGGFGSLFVPDARQATSLSSGVTDEPKGGEVIEADSVEDAKDTLQVSSRSFVESNENKQGGPRVGVFGSIFNSNRSEGMLSEKDHDEEKSESDTEKYSVEVAAESAKSTGPVVEHMGTKSALELEKERQQKLLMDLLKLDENAMKDQQDQQAVLVSQTVSQKKEGRSTLGSESLEAPKELVATVDENDVTAPKNSRFGGFGSLFVPDARQATSLSSGVTDEPKGGEVIEADSVEDAKDTLQVSSRSFVESNENKQGGPRVGVFGSIFNSNRSEGMLSEKDHDEEKSESDTEKYSVEVAAESAKSTGPVVEHMGTKSALELEKERQQKLLMDLLKLDENAMKDQQDQQAVLVSQTVSQKKEGRSTLGSESLEAPKELVATVDENDVTAPKNSRFGGFGSLFVPDARQATSLSSGVTDEPKGGEVIEADSVEDAKDTLQVSSRSFVESNENKQGGPRVGVFGSIFNSNRSEGMLSEKDHDEEKSESDTEKYSVEVAAESAKSTGPVVEHMGTKSALELEKERQQKLLMDLLKLDENAMKDQQDQQAVLVSQTVSQKKEGRSTLGSESLEAPKELVATVDENDVTAPKNSRFGGFGSLFVPDARQATSLSSGVTDEPKGGEVIEADSVEDAKDTLQVSSRSFVESNENKQGGPRVGVFGSIFNSNRSEGMLSEKDHDEEKSESDTEKYSVEVAAESAKSTGPVVEHMGTKSALELEKERQQKLLMDLLKLDENAMKDQQDQQAVLVSQTVSQKKEGRSTLGSESLEAPKELVATVDENDVTAPKNSRFGGFGSLFVPDARQATSLSSGVTDEPKGGEVIEADSVEDAKDTLQVSSRSFVESNENKQGGPRVGVFGSIFNSNRSEGMLSEKDHDEEKSESDTEKYSVEVAAESAKSTGPVVEHMGTKSALELEKERQQKLLMDLLKLDENAMKDQQDQQAVLVSQTVSQKQKKELSERAHDELVAAEEIPSPYQSGNRFGEQKPQQQKIADEEEWESSLEPQSSEAAEEVMPIFDSNLPYSASIETQSRRSNSLALEKEEKQRLMIELLGIDKDQIGMAEQAQEDLILQSLHGVSPTAMEQIDPILDPTPLHEDNDFAEEDGFAISQIESVKQYEPILVVQDVTAQKAYSSAVHDDMVQGNSTSAVRDETFEGAKDQESVSSDIRDESVPQMAENMSISNRGFAGSASPGRLSLIQTVSSRFRPSVRFENDGNRLEIEKQRQQRLLLEQLNLDEGDFQKKQLEQEELIRQCILGRQQDLQVDKVANGVKEKPGTNVAQAIEASDSIDGSKDEQDSQVLLWWRQKLRDKNDKTTKMVVPSEASVQSELISDLGSTIDSQGSDEDIKVHDNNEPGMDFGSPSQQQDGAISSMIKTKEATTSVVDTKDDTPTKSNMSPIESPCEKEMPTDVGEKTNDTVVDIQIDQARSHQSMPSQNAGNESLVKNSDGIAAMNNSYPNKTTKPISSTDSSALASQPSVKSIESPKPGEDSPGERSRSNSIGSVDHQHITRRKLFCTDKTTRENSILFAHSAENEDPANNEMDDFVAKDLSGARDSVKMDSNIMDDGDLLPKSKPLLQVEQMEVEHEDSNSIRKGFGTPTVLSVAFLRLPEPDVKGTKETNLNKDGPSQVVKSWGSKRVHKFFGTSTVLSDAFLRLPEPDLKQMAEENLKANGPLQVTESVDKKRIQKYFGTPTILPGAFLQLQEHGTHQSARKILHGHDSIAVKPSVTQDDLVPNDRSLPKLEENIDILIHEEVDISRTNPKTIQKGFGTPTILPGAFLQLPENNAHHQDAKDNLLEQNLLPDQFLVTEDDPVPDDRSVPEWEENNDLLIQKTVDLDMDVEAEVGKASHESDSSVHDVEITGPDKDHPEARVKGSDNGPSRHRIETTEPFKSDQAVDLVAAGDHTASAKDSIEEDIPRVGPLLEIAEIAVAESDENKICALVKQIDTALTAQASKEQESYKREQKHSSDQEGKTVISETDDSADATINISMLADNDTLDISDNINILDTVTRARAGTVDVPIHSLAEDATLSEGRRSNSEHSDRLPVDFEAEQPCRLYHGQGSNKKTATTDVKVATEDVRAIDNTRTKVDNKMVQSESSIDGSHRLEDPRVLAFDSAATLIKEPVMLCVNDESEKEVTLGRPSSNMLGTLQMFRDDPIIPSIHVDHENTKEAKLDFDIENLKKAAIEQNDHLQPIIKDTSSRKVERVPAVELQLEDNNLIVTVDGDRVEGAFDISEIRDLEKRERLFADMQSALPGVAISSSQGNQICIRLNLAGRRMGFKVENNKVSLLADPFALPIQNAPWDQIEDENKGIVQSVMSANKAEDQMPEAGKIDSDQKENYSSHLKPHGGSPKPLTVRDDLVKHADDSVQNFRAKNMTSGSKQKEDPPQEQPVPFDEGGSFHSKLSIAPFDEKGSFNTKQMPVPFDERESFNSDSGKTEDTKQSISLDKPHKQARQDLERLDESMDNMPMVVDMDRIPNATIAREQYAGIKSAAWQLLNDESQTKPCFLPLWEEASQRTEDVPPLPQVPIALSLDNGGRSSSIRGDLDTPKKTAKNHVSMSEETDRTTASTVKAKDAGKDSKNLNPENNGSDYLARYIAARSKATARARNDLKTTLDTTKTRRKRDPSERINAKKVVPAKICTVDRRVFSLPQNVGTAEPEGIRISPKGKSGAATGAVNTTKSSRFTYPSGELAIVDYERNARRGRGRGLVSNADSETRKKPKDHQSRQHCDRNVDTSSYSRDSFRAPQSARSRPHPYIWNKGGDEWQQEQLGLGLGLGRPEMYRAPPGAFFYEDSAKDKYSSYPSDLPNAQSRYTSPYLNDLSRQAYGRSALGAYAPNQTTLLRKQKHTSSTNRAKEMDAPITSSDRRFQRKRIKAKMKRLKTTVSKMEDK
ncbi:unnamed protein product [Cylindrotheca closterium]|uniref:Uncharacterized protein n=1 Tax=Cylindrotheca closterium TaxID=2856 RepID=A0AAD2FGT4_9STRA|nr:unnamed protein product [Cylindrotheca closterium]